MVFPCLDIMDKGKQKSYYGKEEQNAKRFFSSISFNKKGEESILKNLEPVWLLFPKTVFCFWQKTLKNTFGNFYLIYILNFSMYRQIREKKLQFLLSFYYSCLSSFSQTFRELNIVIM